jgi:hypothetical protein
MSVSTSDSEYSAPAPNQTHASTAPPKMTKNVRVKSKPEQKSSKAKKGQATIAADNYDAG